MILVDANIVIYASSSTFEQHAAAKDWLDRQLNGTARVGLPWATLLAFLRVMTNRRAVQFPLTMMQGWEQVIGWLGAEPSWVPGPTEEHAEVLGRLLAAPGVRGNLVHDADLAALAIEHGLILCTTDGDFAHFPELRWQNPLVA
ncbi:MAG: TA system VapC family ribonuclease toxin [Thiohalocapsa sp.]